MGLSSHFATSDSMENLEDLGRVLAKEAIRAVPVGTDIIKARLSDLLPRCGVVGNVNGVAIEHICMEIPMSSLHFMGVAAGDLTDIIYQLLEGLSIEEEAEAGVLSFFRGFCREFFFLNSSLSREKEARVRDSAITVSFEGDELQQESAEMSRILATRPGLWKQARLQQASEIPVNFNDLLAILQDSYVTGRIKLACEKERQDGDAHYMYSVFIKVIEAMTNDERLEPSLLLDHYDLARRRRRRLRIATSAGISLSLVDHCLAALGEFRRNYQLYLQGIPHA